MKIDYIDEIIEKLSDFPYKCILFDGEWGIGKTYVIREALKEKDNVCKISMFGLQNSQQIYHEALFQLALKNNDGGKIGEIAKNVLEGVSNIWKEVAQAKDVLQSITKERELFLLLSNKFDSWHTIVIDDLERTSNNVNMEDVLGVVEELKQCNYVKVILVANLKELDCKKDIFEKYNEKVVDKIYKITERAENVNWRTLGIHAGFINNFLSKHKVKNLRTLQKAQNFYDDVKLYFKDINNEQFMNEVMLICFAIVVESVDNLYYRELDDKEQNFTKRFSDEIQNGLEHRIGKYLTSVNSNGLVRMLLKYYNNEEMLVFDNLKMEYELFLQAGSKLNYYKSDEEIKRLFPDLLEKINGAKWIGELNKFVDEYVIWSNILEMDITDILEIYKTKVHNMLLESVINGYEDVLSFEYNVWHIESEKIKQIYFEQQEIVRKELIAKCVESLVGNTRRKEAFEYSYKLRKYFESKYYRDIIKEFADSLYNANSFPIGSIEEEQYYTCYNIMYVLYWLDNDKFLLYCEDLIKICDKMSAYRVNNLIEQIKKEI